MGKKIAVTGVNSYFASTLLPHLQADPTVETIVGIDITPWKGGYGKVKFVRRDIRDPGLRETLRDVDTVYHLAFIVEDLKDKAKTYDVNIEGSRNVFQACIDNGVRKVVYTSSNTVYGVDKENPLPQREETPIQVYEENYYNKSKIAVEKMIERMFSSRPEVTVTILRVALVFGPRTQNMFSKTYGLKVAASPVGAVAHIHFIHEDDLGEALHLALVHDLRGVYNVGADDAASSAWCFRMAGVKIIPMPEFLLKPLVNMLFRLGAVPVSASWLTIANRTIFSDNSKFKRATGWRPKYSSEETFLSFLDARKRPKNEKVTQSVVASLLKYRSTVRGVLRLTNLGFMIGKIPWVNSVYPWTNPKKNSITYLPVNEHVAYREEEVLPQTVHNLIDKAFVHVIMDRCACRFGEGCQNHPVEIGCLFLGESALEMPENVRRRVSREEAHGHVERAISAGLVPMVGKVRYDNDAFMIPDRRRLLAVCFCCHCCCMMRYYKHLPASLLDQVMPRVEGFSLTVTDACVGCGTCTSYCGWDAIRIENGRAVHSDKCRGCGRCADRCPHGAVRITIGNPQAVKDV
ncbi:MAG: NAD-dependent epimerase/dehydratase family protein [candidate division KSB1 bacterium]|nr:NAD-dependent epimerase/dehydratase family protein [candidate division KSB1 bacterium]